ncbi:DNA repair protein rad16 [Ascosphaera aggregata]|nr:DNA repair protein rad16 [Ascosphaera aggregata]
MTNSTRQFETYVSRGVMLSNYANIFGLIMQMRQVANHPDLIVKKHAEGNPSILSGIVPLKPSCHTSTLEKQNAKSVTQFAADKDEYRYLLNRSRNTEYESILSTDLEPILKLFDQILRTFEAKAVKMTSIVNRIDMESWTSSTKIEMLVYELYKLRSKKQTQKSIVFSQFTSMLQLVEWRLRRAGFSTVMLDGSMSPAQRQKSIEFFKNNVNVEVFLVSLKAGGVALNLTEASRVFIVDPLCIEDSVESRMVLLQEKKANMINGTINKDQNEALESLRTGIREFRHDRTVRIEDEDETAEQKG